MQSTRYPPIKGFIETSFIDWPGSISSVIFVGGCNFRCPFCHNSALVLRPKDLESIPLGSILKRLKRFKSWVDRIVVTGGEPTIHKGLFRLLRELKSHGFMVKLDTNGSRPAVLEEVLKEGLVDYVAMDLKGPLRNYSRWCGVKVDRDLIRRSIELIFRSKVDYEFRMTFVPGFHEEEDVYDVANMLRGVKRFTVQEFRPRDTIDPSFLNISPCSSEKMDYIRKKVREILGSPDLLEKTLQPSSP